MTVRILFADGKSLLGSAVTLDQVPTASQGTSHVIAELKEQRSYLESLPVDSLVAFFDKAAATWSSRDSSIQKEFGDLGINFLLSWLKKSSLEHLLDGALRGNRQVLDRFVSVPPSELKLGAFPRGLVVHWLAGNVPVLGLLSVVQALLTKNINLVKVARDQALVFPKLLAHFAHISTAGPHPVDGAKLLKCISVFYCEATDLEAQQEVSIAADVRIAWGGLEAVESILNFSRRYGTEDIILGPKTSFVVIGKEFLQNEEESKKIAFRIARDASAFDQKGCNSPHTVFLEQASDATVSTKRFSELLAEGFKASLALFPKGDVSAADAMKINALRTEYEMRSDSSQALYSPRSVDWTVVSDCSDCGLAEPCFYRTLFVREIDSIENIPPLCSHLTQSIGTALAPNRKESFARAVMQRGVERCPEVGAMSFYDSPWDGMFMTDRLVRWTRLSETTSL